jgi:hypothetical protein
LANAPFVVELGAALVALLNQVSPAALPSITPPAPMFTKTNERGVKVTVFVFEYAPPPIAPPPITSIVADVQSTGTLNLVPDVITMVTVGIKSLPA